MLALASPSSTAASWVSVLVMVLLTGAIPGLWKLHRWLNRIERGLQVVEERSVQLTKNSGTHVADMPEAVKRIETELRRVGDEATRAATSARASADLAVASSTVAVRAVESVASEVRAVGQMVTLHMAAGHKEHAEKKETP